MDAHQLQKHLHKAVRRSIHALECAIESGHKGMPADASILNDPRLILCLTGTAHYQIQRNGHPCEIQLLENSALFVAYESWVYAVPREKYLVLGMIFEPEALRAYTMGSERGRSGWKTRQHWEFIFRHPLPEDARTLCRILGAGSSELYHRKIAEALMEFYRGLLQKPLTPPAGRAIFTWQAAVRFVSDNVHKPLGREQAAEHLRVHPNHLSRLFLRFSGMTFSAYLQERRLERARLLLKDARLNVGEIATLSGFSSASYFIRLHRKRFGLTPGEARTD